MIITNTNDTNMIEQDIPLIDIEDDSIGRSSMVELIVDSINEVVSSDHQCVVYGIYGKWGEGKTSLMNFIKNKLLSQGKTDNINIVEFNPWLVNNDGALLREFFLSIMAYADETARKLFNKYGSLAIFASKTIVNAVVPGLGSVMADGIELAKNALEDSKDTLAELKKKVSEAIRKSKKHIVVMIDDVDRLDKEELHALLRLIRQVADFENCIYVVSMDADMVAKSIAGYHGNGTVQDGRRFLDKIIQVPIVLPQIPVSDMRKFVRKYLKRVLGGFADNKKIGEVADAVTPFITTMRELKRYCNQLSFVLPHLVKEVNIRDLCLVEAIKIVNIESYQRIHERRDYLKKKTDDLDIVINQDEALESVEKNYQEAKVYITEGMTGRQKDVVDDAIDELFNAHPIDNQDDLDEKRLNTDVYFQKYFTMTVPSDVIPDTDIEAMLPWVEKSNIELVRDRMNTWTEEYSASEVKRAALFLIRMSADRDKQCLSASVIARALSVSRLSENLPPFLYVNQDSITSFVPIQIIRRYMFFQTDSAPDVRVRDDRLLDETLDYIFQHGHVNYCLNVLCSSSYIFRSGTYDGRSVIKVLAERFTKMTFKEQFTYSKLLLETMLKYWKGADKEAFNSYAKRLFDSSEIAIEKVLDKFIDGEDDGNDVITFVELFKLQIPQINQRLQEIDEEIKNRRSVKIYQANYIEAMRSCMEER